MSVDLMPPSSGLRKQLAEAHLHMQVQNIGVGPALWGIFLLGGDFVALTQQEAKEKIIVALDVPNQEQALQLVEQLYDEVGAFKIGMQLYNAEGPSIVKEIQRLGGKVFIDLKLHDIPNTVAEATKVGVSVFGVVCSRRRRQKNAGCGCQSGGGKCAGKWLQTVGGCGDSFNQFESAGIYRRNWC